MAKEHDQAEAHEKMPASPQVDVMPQPRDKMGAPESDKTPPAPGQGGAPAVARKEDLSKASNENLGAPGRARMMQTVQRTIGNTRVGLASAAVQRQPDGGTKKDTPDAGTSAETTATVPDYVTDDLKQKMTATILAESAEGQESDIRWMYYNRVTAKKGIEGLKGSAAFRNKGIWYRIWLYVLGDHTHGKDDLPKQKEFKGFSTVKDFCEKNEWIKSKAAERAKDGEKLVGEMFGKPESNPFKGWTGQGNLNDFNNKSKPKSRYWKMARAYYWLQQKGTVKETYVKVLSAGKNTQVIFDGDSIEKYYKTHDLPDTVPLYEVNE